MKIVIVGATRGIGRGVARRLAERGDELFLLGRDAEQLQRSAADLTTRGKVAVAGTAMCDIGDSASHAAALDAAESTLGGLDAVIVTAGLFGTQEQLESDLERTEAMLTVNLTGTILFCERARVRLLSSGGGTLCVCSSVAGDKARKPVVLYGASKAGLSYYLDGLDHRYRADGLVTVCIKPGFVKTGMTSGLQPPPFAGEVDGVARDIVRAIDRGTPVTYTPGIWRLVMLVIRQLPRFVMRKIGF